MWLSCDWLILGFILFSLNRSLFPASSFDSFLIQILFFLLFLCKLFFLFIFLVNQQFFSDLLFLLFSDWFKNLFWNPYLSWDNLFHSCFWSFFCRIFWIFAVIAVYLPLIFISFAFLLSCSLQASLFTYQSIRSLYKGSALFLFLLQLLQISLSSLL